MIKTIFHFFLQVVVLFILGLYAFGFNYSLGWYLFYFYGLFCFVNWVLWLLPSRFLLFSLNQTITHVQTKEKLPIHFNQKRHLYPHITINGENIVPDKQEIFYLSVFFKYRGTVDTLPLSLEIRDLTGKLRRRKRYLLNTELLILPKLNLEYSQNLYAFLLKKGLLHRKDEFSSEIADHRSYHYGDPLNQINWKLSARMEDLVTRELLPEKNQPILALLWSDSEELLGLYYSLYQQHKNDFHFVLWSQKGVLSQNIPPKEWADYHRGDPPEAMPKNRSILLFSEQKESTNSIIDWLQQNNSVTRIEQKENLQIHGKKQRWTLPKVVAADD